MWILSVIATTASAVITWWWNTVDGATIDRTDQAGWDGAELLPAQNLIWVAVNTQFFVLLATSILTTVLVVRYLRSQSRERAFVH
ncbi:hypothetical protein ATY41_02565 [Leifsonia xyli subsp. xyli]|uniref:Uncharacterized protein n=1 Tax=Leifsonia xyli subsp. xyli TaxID=59736 RepID=A0A1E2SJB8_LEIXY|nr:hypothetical protein ATY41_02565 [Leifsonia xyli subsp. xyli]